MLVAAWQAPKEQPWIAPQVRRSPLVKRRWHIELYVIKDGEKDTWVLRPRERYDLSQLIDKTNDEMNKLLDVHNREVEAAGFRVILLR